MCQPMKKGVVMNMNDTNPHPDTDEKGTNPSKGPEEAATVQNQLKDVVENGAVTTNNGRHVIHCLTIIGQIEGHYALSSENKTTKYEHVIPQLVAIEESPGDARACSSCSTRSAGISRRGSPSRN